jgi:hypothetical protein
LGRTPGLAKFNTACLRIQTLFKKQKPHEHLSEVPVDTGIHMDQRCVVDLFMITSSKYEMKFPCDSQEQHFCQMSRADIGRE